MKKGIFVKENVHGNNVLEMLELSNKQVGNVSKFKESTHQISSSFC